MGLGLYFLKMLVNLSQYHGRVGLFNSRSFEQWIDRKSTILSLQTTVNNTYIAWSLISVNKILLFFSLFSALFFLKDNVSKTNRQFLVSTLFSSTILAIPFVFFFSLLVSLSGDIEVNSGPNSKPNEALSICYWNLNSISAHNFAKLHLLKAHVTVHKFDMICLWNKSWFQYSIWY